MSEDEFDEDRLVIGLYRAAARERPSRARDTAILQYAQARAQRAGLFRRVSAAAVALAMVFFAWQGYRDNVREAAGARARSVIVAHEYLLTMQVANASVPSAVTQYLLGLQLDDPSSDPAQTSH